MHQSNNSIRMQNSSSLRALCARSKDQVPPPHCLLKALFRRVACALSVDLFPPAEKQSMCKYYGHVIDRKNWTQSLPRCADCNVEINSRDQLRTSQEKRRE